MLRRRKSTTPEVHVLARRLFVVDPYEGSVIARRLGDELRKGDRAAVRAIVAQGVGWTDLVSAINGIAVDEAARNAVEAWFGDEPDDLFVLTVQASVLSAWAMRRRLDNNRADDPELASSEIEDLLLLAEDRLVVAASRAPAVPLPWAFLVRTGVALTIPHAEVVERWSRARRELDVTAVRAPYVASVDIRPDPPAADDYLTIAEELTRDVPLGDVRHAAVTHVLRRLALRVEDERVLYRSHEDLLRTAAARSVLHPTFDPAVPDGLVAMNWFAFSFARMGDLDLADELLERVDWHICPEPWVFLRPNPIDGVRALAAFSA